MHVGVDERRQQMSAASLDRLDPLRPLDAAGLAQLGDQPIAHEHVVTGIDVGAGVQDVDVPQQQLGRCGRPLDESGGGHYASWGSGTGLRDVRAGEQLIQHGHAHDHAGLHLLGDERLGRVDDLAGELDATVDRAGVHQHLARREPAAVDLIPGGVLAQRRHPLLAHTLVLHAQRIHHIGRAQLVQRVAHLAAERLDPARDQRRRAGDRDAGAHALERDDVRARHARMGDVADDPDRAAVDPAETLAQRVYVQQCLGRVLVLAVAGVDDRRAAPAGDELGRARPGRAQDDRVGLVRAQREDGVLQRLALLDARAVDREVDHVRGQALGGQLE